MSGENDLYDLCIAPDCDDDEWGAPVSVDTPLSPTSVVSIYETTTGLTYADLEFPPLPPAKLVSPVYLTDWDTLERYCWDKYGYEIDHTCFELTAEHSRNMTAESNKALNTCKSRRNTIQMTKEQQMKKTAEYETLKKRSSLSTKESDYMDTLAQEIGDHRAKIGNLEKEIMELEKYSAAADVYAKHLVHLYNAEKLIISCATKTQNVFKTETNIWTLIHQVAVYRDLVEKYMILRNKGPKYPSMSTKN